MEDAPNRSKTRQLDSVLYTLTWFVVREPFTYQDQS